MFVEVEEWEKHFVVVEDLRTSENSQIIQHRVSHRAQDGYGLSIVMPSRVNNFTRLRRDMMLVGER